MMAGYAFGTESCGSSRAGATGSASPSGWAPRCCSSRCAASTCTAIRGRGARGIRARRGACRRCSRSINTNKYPASLDFLLMTLGPTIAVIPLVERCARRAIASDRDVRPRAVVLLRAAHPADPLPGARGLADPLGRAQPVAVRQPSDGRSAHPDGYAWSLPLLYLVWAIAIAMLYFACRWFAELKRRRSDWWLS